MIKTATSSAENQIISSSSLLLIAFATVFFSRLLESFGAPSPINFLHFIAIPFACGVALLQSKINNRSQINTCRSLLLGILFFLLINLSSALLNKAGLINVVLKTLLLVEPFLFLTAIVCLPISSKGLKKLRTWFERFVFLHLFLIYVQKFALKYCSLPGDCDNIQGVFYHSGSGHVVGASVSISFAIYYYFAIAKSKPQWMRVLVLIGGLGNVFAADAKQVLLTLILGFAIIALTKSNISNLIIYLTSFVLFVLAFNWVIQNVAALSSFNTWMRPEIYEPDGEATKLKLSGIRIILEHFHTPLNWFFGLGPGHTIDRLGGWMLRDYEELLSPLGATRSTIGSKVWQYVASSWLAKGSSLFAPFWGWAAIWGDLGFLGLAVYLYLASVVWRKLCLDDISRYLMLTIMVHGFILTQLEEPSYMLSMAIILGLRWHEKHIPVNI